jgi:hypothetical protein
MPVEEVTQQHNAEPFLRNYLERLSARYNTFGVGRTLPIYDSPALSDLELGELYVPLATEEHYEHQSFSGDELHHFRKHIKEYIAQHVGEHIAPEQQWLDMYVSTPAIDGSDGQPIPLDQQNPEAVENEITRILQSGRVEKLAFFGPQSLTAALQMHQQLMLLGEAGSGKSMTLAYLAAREAQRTLAAMNGPTDDTDAISDPPQHTYLPILLSLAQFARHLQSEPQERESVAELCQYMITSITKDVSSSDLVPVLTRSIKEQLQAGRIFLLLDGLDEIVESQMRRHIAEVIRAFASTYTQCRIVMTCRVRFYEEDILPVRRTLAEFNLAQIDTFINGWYKTLSSRSSDTMKEHWEKSQQELKRTLTTHRELQQLGSRPLLLTIMLLMHRNDGHVWRERIRLYERFLDVFLGMWEMVRSDTDYYGTLTDYLGFQDHQNILDLLPFLQEIAFRMHAASDGTTAAYPEALNRTELHTLLIRQMHLWHHPQPKQAAQRFLEYIDKQAGLLKANGSDDTYTFAHPTLREYLAGLQLVRDIDPVSQLMQRRHDKRWHGPILFGLGHLVNQCLFFVPYEFLACLIEEGIEQNQPDDLFLAADIAEDITWEKLQQGQIGFADLEQKLLEGLQAIVEREHTTETIHNSVRAGSYLGVFGDSRPGVCTLPPAMARIPYHASEPAGTARPGGREHGYTIEISRYPITNAQFHLFLQAQGGAYHFQSPWWKGLDVIEREYPRLWHDERYGVQRPNCPVAALSLFEALAFCRWLSENTHYNRLGYRYRLPNKHEWDYVAGTSTDHQYPWGVEVPNIARANYDKAFQGTTAVGCFRAGRPLIGTTQFDVYDLAGNVREWIEPTGTDLWSRHSTRGGGWNDREEALEVSTTYDDYPLTLNFVGFRVVREMPYEMSRSSLHADDG